MSLEEKLAGILQEITGVQVDDYHENLFGHKYRITPPDMAYFVLELEKAFDFQITDKFIENIQLTTIQNIAACIEKMKAEH